MPLSASIPSMAYRATVKHFAMSLTPKLRSAPRKEVGESLPLASRFVGCTGTPEDKCLLGCVLQINPQAFLSLRRKCRRVNKRLDSSFYFRRKHFFALFRRTGRRSGSARCPNSPNLNCRATRYKPLLNVGATVRTIAESFLRPSASLPF